MRLLAKLYGFYLLRDHIDFFRLMESYPDVSMWEPSAYPSLARIEEGEIYYLSLREIDDLRKVLSE